MQVTKVSASKLARVMTCKGSLHFENLPTPEENELAKQGTAFSELMEKTILGVDPGEYATNGVIYDEEMHYHKTWLMDYVRGTYGEGVKTEEWATWITQSGIKIPGKYDLCSWVGEDLYIGDFKYGYGIVEPENNWQLIAYAIGEVIQSGKAPEIVYMTIIQPRAHHHDGSIRTWSISYTELLEYMNQIQDRFNELAAGENKLETGKHCKYCPGAAHCPAMNEYFHQAYEVVHDFVQDNMDGDSLSKQLDMVDRFSDMLKTRKSSLELLAKSRISEGQDVPNYTVKPKSGHRKWNMGVNPDVIKTITGVDVMESKLMSPAAAERRGLKKDFLDNFTSKPQLAPSLQRSKKDAGNKIFGNKPPEIKGE